MLENGLHQGTECSIELSRSLF